MKSILIPTVLENDTLHAVETAIKHAKGKRCSIVLLMLAEAPDASSGAEFLRKGRKPLTAAQCGVLDECRARIKATGNCLPEIHHQYGMSAAVLRNLLDYLNTDMIILSPSYKSETKKIHCYFCRLLLNCKKPILHLASGTEGPGLNKALYIGDDTASLGILELQQLLSRQFDFKIVSRAHVAEEQNPGDLTPFLNEAILKNNIDLLIETRKAEKIIPAKRRASVNDTFGLPVLSIHEEAVGL